MQGGYAMGGERLGLVTQLAGIEREERQRVGQLRHRHVDELAVAERPNPYRQLRLVRVGLDNPRVLPGRQFGKALSRRSGANEVRDAAVGIRARLRLHQP
jgi:hypothetical protein